MNRSKTSKKKSQPKKNLKEYKTAVVVASEQVSNVPAIIKRHLDLDDHKQVMDFAVELSKFIESQGLSVEIQGNRYSNVQGWQFGGNAFGLTAVPDKPTREHQPGEYNHIIYAERQFYGEKGKYTKEVPIFIGRAQDIQIIQTIKDTQKGITRELVRPFYSFTNDCVVKRMSDDKVIMRGAGLCSNIEMNKIGFEEYAVSSMCETRSIGKSYRNLIGWVMKAAGYQQTSAEEITKEDVETNRNAPEAESSLPMMGQIDFERGLDDILAGKMTVEHLEMAFFIPNDMKIALQAAQANAKKK